MGILENVNSPKDIKNLSIDDLKKLAQEIREIIIDVVSKNGGHLAPNLGVVELTLALHYVFDAPRDKIIWDVSHQVYPHKLITGRRDVFHTLRKLGGISGFATREESIYDPYGAGHASTSLSAALGFAVARDLMGEKYKVVAVIGDGALTGGPAWEALNNIGWLQKDLFIVLNDNEHSIDKNVGGISMYLAKILSSDMYFKFKDEVWNLLGRLPENLSERAREIARKLKESILNLSVPTILFEEIGIKYYGPFNGHDLKQLIENFSRIKKVKGPVIVHVITKKGKGYKPAERDPGTFHGIGPFDKKTGKPYPKKLPRFSKFYAETLVKFAKKDKKIVAITAAMPHGTGLIKFKEEIPERYFDVGIAEMHAVLFSTALALQGLKPFCTIYSTFLQRAFDALIHDTALQKAPVRFAIDRGGVVGDDGPTHQGVFDLSYLRIIPNMVVMAPKDEDELQDMIKTALEYDKGPIAFRYPRGSIFGVKVKEEPQVIPIGKAEVLKEGEDLMILAIGVEAYYAKLALEELNRDFLLINARFVKPIDEELILSYLKTGKFKKILTIEDNTIKGGFGSAVLEVLAKHNINNVEVKLLGIPDRYIQHGSRDELLHILKLDKDGIKEVIKEFMKL
ncbi:1-deoxy-D-xylulose-5-phosphate synthase [Candidatus Pacearchaeota archaeon]|nr:MAG: 1-deoxy-D-xylulose-5-phosphate synthase [Candidatus Pacearchaeota archaeon]